MFRAFQGCVVAVLVLATLGLVLTVSRDRHDGIRLPAESLSLQERSETVPDVRTALALLADPARGAREIPDIEHASASYWLSLTLDPSPLRGSFAIEFRMLRARNPQFWSVEGLPGGALDIKPLVSKTEKGGTTVFLDAGVSSNTRIIGLIEPIGFARPKVYLWGNAAYTESVKIFEREGGTLIGAFLMLALFSVIVGLVNRDWSFFLFSGWLITSLRVASVNDGWDLAWLGLALNNEVLLTVLRLTLAAHAVLTVALFRSLLRFELRSVGLEAPFRLMLALAMMILPTAFLLPHALFLKTVWLYAGLGIAFILFSLFVISTRRRTRVSAWYASSWVVTFAGILGEVASASGMIGTKIPGLDAKTGAIAAALLTAIALAERLKKERNARLAAQKESLALLSRFKDTYNAMPVGLFSVNAQGQVVLTNPAFREMFKVPGGGALPANCPFDALMGPGVLARLQTGAESGYGEDIEVSLASEGGGVRWFLIRVQRTAQLIEGAIQDITARKAADAQLKRLVDHDYLTGLLNRRGIEAQIGAAIDLVRAGRPCAIAYVDLDRFKLINDLYGHAIGDSVLAQAGRRLQSAVRAQDQVGRVADGFVAVFLDCQEAALAQLTDRLKQSLSDGVFEVQDKALAMTASVGVVSIDPSMTALDAKAAADRACAEAKSRGRNCVVRLTERDAVLRAHLEELKVVADLQQHVPTERFFLEFQPVVSLADAASSLSYEILIRMRGEQGEVIPPGRFIGAAERNGLMSQIDRWVLQQTLRWLDSNPAHRDRISFATINLSGASLNDARFIDDAIAMMIEHQHSMAKLCFEITESVALHDLGATRRFVDRVRMYGSTVALDDFGAGYTSFNYLKEIPANFIKIDGSFVKDINVDPANYAITRTIVDLTHQLGMESIAEWAETPETIAALIELGVDYGQGYGLVRPVTPSLMAQSRNCLDLVPDPVVVKLLKDRAARPISLRQAQPSLRMTPA